VESLQATTENHENCKKNRQRLGNLLKFSESHPNAQGTTAYIAEQWGRRWITIDTSRVALALARTRLMAARNAIRALVDRAPPDLVDIRDMMANFEQSDMNVVFLFKHMLLRYRRYCAAYTEQLLGRTFHLALTGKIKEEVAALDAVANDQWFQAIKPTPLPRLKDYLTISFIEETTKDVAIPPREYDVPHTMCSHPFPKDLAYFRMKCEQRDLPVAALSWTWTTSEVSTTRMRKWLWTVTCFPALCTAWRHTSITTATPTVRAVMNT
jgi:hypothetical protein